jgi:phospholipid/cholesterol/gamma-HCH transport system substrate-binding protein
VRVRLNGITVGEVEEVNLAPPGDPEKVVAIRMRVQTSALSEIPVDSVVEIGAENVLGEKTVEITKGGSIEAIRPGGTLRFEPPREIDRAQVIKSFESNLRRMDAVLDDIEAGRGGLARFIRDDSIYRQVNARLAEVQKGIEESSRAGTLGRLINQEAQIRDARATLARYDKMLADVESGQGAAGGFLRDSSRYDSLLQQVRDLRGQISAIERGEGRVGRFVMSDDQYRQWNRSVEQLLVSVDRIRFGEGPLGQLFVSAQLYESLNGSSKQLQEFLREFQENPRKFLRVEANLF